MRELTVFWKFENLNTYVLFFFIPRRYYHPLISLCLSFIRFWTNVCANSFFSFRLRLTQRPTHYKFCSEWRQKTPWTWNSKNKPHKKQRLWFFSSFWSSELLLACFQEAHSWANMHSLVVISSFKLSANNRPYFESALHLTKFRLYRSSLHIQPR